MNTLPQNIKKIYFMAICGTGMGSLAGLLQEKGYIVKGSDQNVYPPMSTELQNQGIEIFSPYNPKNIQNFKPDLVIIGNAISKTNCEADFVLKNDIPYISMPAALNHFFLQEKDVIVVSGTHGKTTTTALMSHILHQMGQDPSFMVGGVTKNFSKNFKIGSGKYFVIEGDEYDTAFFDKVSKFLHYNPKHVMMTSLEFDHADIFNSLEDIENSFLKLSQIIPKDGSLHINDSYDSLKKIQSQDLPYSLTSYGFQNSDWKIKNYQANENGCEFFIQTKTQNYKVKSPMSGKYNAENITACLSVISKLGLSVEEAIATLTSFEGIKRRQDVIFKDDDFIVIDDFAHHPTAIAKTTQGIREKYPHHKLIAVFEPRSNTSMRDIFQKRFPQSFDAADHVILAQVFNPNKIKDGGILNVSQIVDELQNQGISSSVGKDTEEILQMILKEHQKKSVVLIMSNGGFDGIHQKLVKKYQEEN